MKWMKPLIFGLTMLGACPVFAQDQAPIEPVEEAGGLDVGGDELDAEIVVEPPSIPRPTAPTEVAVVAPDFNSGLNLKVSWESSADPAHFAVLRSAESADGPWVALKADVGGSKRVFSDTLQTPPQEYWYQVVALGEAVETSEDQTPEDFVASVLNLGVGSAVVKGTPVASLWKTRPNNFFMFFLVIAVGVMMFVFNSQARKGKVMKIRHIAGIDAIEEGIGRSTEMGKPVLYVPGIGALDDIQTIASMLILGEVAHTIAQYQSDVIVSTVTPLVREVADEVVRAGYFKAGHPDAYEPTSVRFIAAEQFAFTAGTNGIMYREKPSTILYMGTFFAESLILAETGFINQAIQIAGSASTHQLPFFIAACDYTIIGEELFAVSGYLSGDPRIVSSLKASDWVKVAVVLLLAVGVVWMTLDTDTGTETEPDSVPFIKQLFTASEG